MQAASKTIISVHKPVLRPKFTNIGYGNPRYNQMLVCPDETVIVPCGASLRKLNIIKNEVILNKQIGCSQIYQVLQNSKWIMVVSFEGLISLLNKETLEVEKQFNISGKQIRHSSITDQFIAVSCELNIGFQQANLEIYSLEDIFLTKEFSVEVKPIFTKAGYYYFPEVVGSWLYFIQYGNPNLKARQRTQTALNKKLPIKYKVLRKDLLAEKQVEQIYCIQQESQIVCAAYNFAAKQIFYLHRSKNITVLNLSTFKCNETSIVASSSPYCIEPFKEGVIFVSRFNQLTYFLYANKPIFQTIELKIKGLASNSSIKQSKQRKFIFFNENGLQLYDQIYEKIYSQRFFDITNCGVSFNQDASKFAVADFGGNIYIFSTNQQNIVPSPLSRVLVGMPVRSLFWCHDTKNIVIGCVGGFLFSWDGVSEEAALIAQTNDHSVNILRYYKHFVIFGTSNGFVHIMESASFKQIYRLQAHTPIHYENQMDRQLFGSMKNYAQIWSIIAYPTSDPNTFRLATCSQDQSEKVFIIQILETGEVNHKQNHHLVGHSLAVTSIDWKKMGKRLGPIYVSSSDDKIVRFRNPENMFQILHELETSTIKQWHTLTYLALEPDGHRVAIRSQNGYLFIFDILTKQLMFGEKIHLDGVEGMDWLNGKLITCSSDLCISIAHI